MQPGPRRRAGGRFAAKIGLAALGTLAGLVAAELAFRVWGPGPLGGPVVIGSDGERVPAGAIRQYLTSLGHREPSTDVPPADPHGLCTPVHVRLGYANPRWSYFDRDGTVEVRCNRLGFRDEDFELAKAPGEVRVLAIGDSFTFGLGVRAEDSWPEVLEDALRARGTRPVQVINAGFAGGHSPAQQGPWLASDGIHFAPDVVVVGFCLNDMGEVPLLSYPVVERTPVLGGCSQLLDEVVRQVRQHRARAAPRDHLLAMLGLVREFEPWRASQQGLRTMRDLLAARGVPMLVAVFPMLTELERRPFATLHALVAEFCAGEGIACVDLAHVFDGIAEEDLWVHPTDQHPNDRGHRLMAAAILAELDRRGFVPR